ncbi:MAG: YncE family protein, partial [Myxococcota bacterium]
MRISVTLLAHLAIALVAAARDVPPELTPARTIPLPAVSGRIDHLAYDPKSQRLFIAALGNDSLEVVDLSTGTHVRTLPGLKEPQGVALVPSIRRILVACGGDGSLHSFDCDSLKKIGKLALGDDADNARATADGATVLVGFGSGALAIVDPAALKKTERIALPGHPESFQLDPNSSRVFVNIPGGVLGGGGAVVVADRST